MKTLIVIPTYNERESLPELLAAIDAVALPVELLFVDDKSPDGTAELIRQWQASRSDIHLLERAGKLGLGTAYLDGFAWALERGYEAIVQMDADLSHNPEHLPAMLAALPAASLAIGSRYVEGGGVENWPKRRQLISRGGSFYARTILGMSVRDLTGGFNVWHRSALAAIDLKAIRSNGYSFQIEMKHQAHDLGLPICEVPIVFRERREGQSKMSKKIFLEAMWRVWLMAARSRRWSPFKKVIKFACVGVIGFVIDMGSLISMVELLGWNLYLANSISFTLAVANNFMLNKAWVFRNDSREYFNQFINFVLVSLVGLGINYLMMKTLVAAQWWYIYAKLVAIALVSVWNYSANNLWTFRKKSSSC